jgi:hypothetical protein
MGGGPGTFVVPFSSDHVTRARNERLPVADPTAGLTGDR